MNNRIRIQNKLIEIAEAGIFYPVSYKERKADSIDELHARRVSPSSVRANETVSSFEVDEKYRRELRLARTGWTFQLILQFDSEVVLEDFEESLQVSPPNLAADSDSGQRSAILLVEDAQYEHPPQSEGRGGTEVKYTFAVLQGRN